MRQQHEPAYILILIHMFIIRSAGRLSKIYSSCLSITPIALLPFRSHHAAAFSSATSKWNKKQFLKKLDKEIIDSHAKIVWQDPETEAYFANKHWKIRYLEEKTCFEYSKIDGQHEVRVLARVMYAPPNDPDFAEEAQAHKNDPNHKQNYSQVAIYIRKKGSQKWLTAEMAVLEGSIQLMGVFFSSLAPDFSWQKGTYPGPQLKTLPEQIVGGINNIFTELGLAPELIMNMVIHASIKVDPLDLEWLKNLRDMWT